MGFNILNTKFAFVNICLIILINRKNMNERKIYFNDEKYI